MASDDLSQTLLGLAAVMSRIAAGTHEMTPEGAAIFAAAVGRAASQALALEAQRDAAYGARPDLAAIRDGMRSGKVEVLPSALAVHAICGDLVVGETASVMPFRDRRP